MHQLIEQHLPSGELLTRSEWDELQRESGRWYDEEITLQGKVALNNRLKDLAVQGEKAAMSFLGMTRAQVQTLTGNKASPARENLEAALRRTGATLSAVVDEGKKRELMIQKTLECFRLARIKRNEPQSALSFAPSECHRIVSTGDLPQFPSYFSVNDWAQLVQEYQRLHDISLLESIAAVDWAFGRMLLDGFRSQVMMAIYEYGGLDRVNLHDPSETPKDKVCVILQLYSGFKNAPDRTEVARRIGIRKATCDKILAKLIEYCGLNISDFEPNVCSLPLLLFKSQGTTGYVSSCLTEMAARRRGGQDVAR